MSVLVVIEHDRGQLADASLEALAFAADVAAQLGVDVEALLIGVDAVCPCRRVRGARCVDGSSCR